MKAVIFDCYGVLSSEGWLSLKQQYFSQDSQLFHQAGALNRDYDNGLSDYQDFLQAVAELAGISPAEVQAQMESNQPNDELFAYIKAELKPHYKIGLLSNAGQDRLPQLFRPEQLALLDAVALSYETGAAKPHVNAYQIIADRLGVAPADCVFVDDQPIFCRAAEAAGMQAIEYVSVEQFKHDLAPLM